MKQYSNSHEALTAFNSGEDAAFDFFYKRYHTQVFVIANRYLNDEDEAKDVRSKTFIKLWQFKGKLNFRSTPQLFTWLRSTARNQCIDYIRMQAIHKSKEAAILLHNALNENVRQVFEVTDKEAAVLDRIMKGVDNLPPNLKYIFKLRCEDELKFRDIAKQLNADVSTIKKRYARALELIKRTLCLKKNLHCGHTSRHLYAI